MWIQIGLMVASFVLSAVLAKKPPTPKPTAFEDFNFPQFEEGTPQVVIFGDVWTESWMVLGVGNYRTQTIKSKGGKK
jgi:hypothetical protein